MRKDMKELSNREEILKRNRMQEIGGGQRRRRKGYDGQDKEEKNLGREREKRKRNVIKEVEVRERKRKETVEEILNGIGVKVKIKEIRKIGEGTERGRRRCYYLS